MIALLWNILLTLAWAALTGVFTLTNLGVGFALGALIMWFAQRAVGTPGYLFRLWKVLELLLFFLKELVWANIRVAFDVVTPRHYMRPGVVAVPLSARTDAEITLLAVLLTLTPGTLSIDISSDQRVLYVHGMYIGDGEETRRLIKSGFERRILEVLR